MPEAQEPAIVVTGVGRVAAAPDVVVVNLGVETSAPTPGEALRRAGEAVAALVALLEREGVAEADRRTTGLSVYPRHDPQTGHPAGHQASYGLLVTVRDLDAAGRLVQAAAEAVADALRVHHFALSVKDPEPHLAEARRAAVRAARAQAEQLAEAAGVALGPLLAVVEGGGSPRELWNVNSGTVGRLVPLAMAAGPPVEPGAQEVAVAVTVTYGVAPSSA